MTAMAIEFIEANSIGVKFAGWLPMVVCDFCRKRIVQHPDQVFMRMGVVLWQPVFDGKPQAHLFAHRMCWEADEKNSGTRYYWDDLAQWMYNLDYNLTHEAFEIVEKTEEIDV
jgi:hypothetical protein